MLTIFYMPFSLGQSVVDGTYLSEGDAAGNGKCTLNINLIAQPHEYGDEVFSLESSGDGSCEWSAIGISKSYTITAGMINNAGINKDNLSLRMQENEWKEVIDINLGSTFLILL